jgi:hypothetical protein
VAEMTVDQPDDLREIGDLIGGFELLVDRELIMEQLLTISEMRPWPSRMRAVAFGA